MAAIQSHTRTFRYYVVSRRSVIFGFMRTLWVTSLIIVPMNLVFIDKHKRNLQLNNQIMDIVNTQTDKGRFNKVEGDICRRVDLLYAGATLKNLAVATNHYASSIGNSIYKI